MTEPSFRIPFPENYSEFVCPQERRPPASYAMLPYVKPPRAKNVPLFTRIRRWLDGELIPASLAYEFQLLMRELWTRLANEHFVSKFRRIDAAKKDYDCFEVVPPIFAVSRKEAYNLAWHCGCEPAEMLLTNADDDRVGNREMCFVTKFAKLSNRQRVEPDVLVTRYTPIRHKFLK